ncbi:hypothetical protein [Pseudomonas iridis]|uniref:hypothetical protein n=1 Tax=Pseudomonas iridis TaxID=2710587 RepID=UPI001B331D1D|nr:hypothetical protein [Pseudomonas iridis]MBP5969925.1 hypothetical protein [Pseudomonas iridis]
MKTEGLSIEVRLPAPGDEEFEALIENITDAVYERVKRRLQEDVGGTKDQDLTAT